MVFGKEKFTIIAAIKKLKETVLTKNIRVEDVTLQIPIAAPTI